ncbi:MAG TPA: hypothetical protein VGF55_31220, partial [Gemmataceae bacterium]
PTHDLGYEPDKFAVKTILAVPGAVLATILIVYVITTLIFSEFFQPKRPVITPESTMAEVRTGAPIDDRLGRISSTDPTAEVLQPRLEGLQRRANYGRDGKPDAVTPEMVPTQPLKEGNSPLYHADDLRPERVPAVSTETKDPQTGAVRSIPVDRAIDLVTNPKNAAWAKALQSREGAVPLELDPHWDRPKESNGGNSRWPARAAVTQPKKGGATEKEPEKKEPEKGAEPKKGAQPKQQ